MDWRLPFFYILITLFIYLLSPDLYPARVRQRASSSFPPQLLWESCINIDTVNLTKYALITLILEQELLDVLITGFYQLSDMTMNKISTVVGTVCNSRHGMRLCASGDRRPEKRSAFANDLPADGQCVFLSRNTI